jgi:hypothetical protein
MDPGDPRRRRIYRALGPLNPVELRAHALSDKQSDYPITVLPVHEGQGRWRLRPFIPRGGAGDTRVINVCVAVDMKVRIETVDTD